MTNRKQLFDAAIVECKGAERPGAWTQLDENLSLLENLSDSEMIVEASVKIRQATSVPPPLSNCYKYAAIVLDEGIKKLNDRQRYIFSVMVAYSKPSDLEAKSLYKS